MITLSDTIIKHHPQKPTGFAELKKVITGNNWFEKCSRRFLGGFIGFSVYVYHLGKT